MAQRSERRRTVTTRSVHVEGADNLKQNLHQIAAEIGRVRDQAQQEVSALERIRGMLDADSLTTLLRAIEELESRVEEMERDSLESRRSSTAIQSQLEQEQERLQKLWDAYKTQEDELERLKRDYPLMEEKLFERERTIENLRREVSRLEPMAKYKSEYDAAIEENDHLNAELDKAEADLERASRALKDLQEEVVSLRAYESDRHRVKELESELETERERLAKLYHVYEAREAEMKDMESRLSEWEKWFGKVRHAFEETGSAPSTAPLRN